MAISHESLLLSAIFLGGFVLMVLFTFGFDLGIYQLLLRWSSRDLRKERGWTWEQYKIVELDRHMQYECDEFESLRKRIQRVCDSR